MGKEDRVEPQVDGVLIRIAPILFRVGPLRSIAQIEGRGEFTKGATRTPCRPRTQGAEVKVRQGVVFSRQVGHGFS